MLLMIEKDIRGGKCHSMIDMKKLIPNTREIKIKIKKHHILNIGMQIIYMNEQCHKSCL